MSILARLVGETHRFDGSYVRQWAERRDKELWNTDDASPESLFVAIMWGVSRFGTEKMPAGLRGMPCDIRAHYSGDATLFEIGCYVFFRIDFWLFANKPELREEISQTLAREFIQLFTKALRIGNVDQLFEERLDGYAGLVRGGVNLEKFQLMLFYLRELILRTKDNAQPRPYAFDTTEPLSLDAITNFLVDAVCLTWEEDMIPGLIGSVDTYCNLVQQCKR